VTNHRHCPGPEALRAERLRGERGAVRKSWRGRRTVALIYPNTYAVGMANLGFQTVYGFLNDLEDVVCERVFAPDPPAEPPWPAPRSLESGRPLTDFDILAFSIAFVSDSRWVLAMLGGAGLPLAAEARTEAHPLIIAGGVACWINPEPLAEVVDAFLVGEAEVLLPAFWAALDEGQPRERQLRRLAREVPGVYVPRFYRPEYRGDDELIGYRLLADVPEHVTRARLADLAESPAVTRVQTAGGPFSADYLVEVSRGCPHGCRFCAAGYVYRPPRFQSLKTLSACLDAVPPGTRRVGLVGAAVSDLPDLDALCGQARARGLSLGFSSFRADAINGALLSALARSGVKTAAIAPETGSQRLRDAINKHLRDAVILDAAERLVDAGIPNLKLYFMIGLPGETEADVAAIVDLVKRVKARFLAGSRSRGRIGVITVSLNPFVPKPFTPLQRTAMAQAAVIKAKIRCVREGLSHVPNVRLSAGKARLAVSQALLALGDRRVGRRLLGRWQLGDPGWADPAEAEALLRRGRPDAPLPWEVIDHGIDRDYLEEEYRRYRQAVLSPPCPPRGCRRCGVCRGEAI
jgi:radical SAM superfamily enzyme YgiQ (UPF0313 family)